VNIDFMRIRTLAFLAILSLPIGFILGYSVPGVSSFIGKEQVSQGAQESRFRPLSMGNTDEVVLIFIGSYACFYSRSDAIPPIIRAAKRAASKKYEANNIQFSSIGVSSGVSVELGLEYIEDVGDFSEVSAGRSWSNSTVEKFLKHHPGEGAIPQIVLLHRKVSLEESGSSRGSVVPRVNEYVLLRKVGLPELNAWSRAGFPLPQIENKTE